MTKVEKWTRLIYPVFCKCHRANLDFSTCTVNRTGRHNTRQTDKQTYRGRYCENIDVMKQYNTSFSSISFFTKRVENGVTNRTQLLDSFDIRNNEFIK